MEREGWCSKLFLGCFACGPGCQDGMVLHAGTVRGKPGKIPTSQAIAHSRVPKWGGGLHPTLQVMDRGVSAVEEPYAVVRGPTCFGGCTELCCKKDFGVSKVPQGWKPGSYKDLHPGDAATITKKKPQSFKGVMKQLFTDADTYLVEFKDPSMTPQQKAAMLGSMLLLDYSAKRPRPPPAPAPPPPPPGSRRPAPGSRSAPLFAGAPRRAARAPRADRKCPGRRPHTARRPHSVLRPRPRGQVQLRRPRQRLDQHLQLLHVRLRVPVHRLDPARRLIVVLVLVLVVGTRPEAGGPPRKKKERNKETKKKRLQN